LIYETDKVRHAIFVFDAEGRLVWRGKIDNRSVDLSKESRAINGMEAILESIPARPGWTPASQDSR
jgi:hypothetical protein